MDQRMYNEFVKSQVAFKPGLLSQKNYSRIMKTNPEFKIYVLNVSTLKIVDKISDVKEAATKYKLSKTSIYQAINGRVKSAGGFFWITCAEYDLYGPKKFENYKTRYSLNGKNPDTGEIVVNFETFTDAAFYGFDRSSIHKCLRGETPRYRGLTWEKVYKNINTKTQ